MSQLAGQILFDSGPHRFVPGPWQRQQVRRGFCGLDGELVINLGLRGRHIAQTGRLQASSTAELQELIAAIEALADGQPRELIDNHDQVYPRVLLEAFEPAGPVQLGRGFFCDYHVRYWQMP
jgi:hypothetical protein